MAIDVTKFREPNGVRLGAGGGELHIALRDDVVEELRWDVDSSNVDEDGPDLFQLEVDREGRQILIQRREPDGNVMFSGYGDDDGMNLTNIASDHPPVIGPLDSQDEHSRFMVLIVRPFLAGIRQDDVFCSPVEQYEIDAEKHMIVVQLPDWIFEANWQPPKVEREPAEAESKTVSA